MAAMQRFEKGVGSINGVGEFFVNEQCIDCDLCRQIAPDTFKRKMSGTGGRSIVASQPTTNLELRKANEALDACPVSAIRQMAVDMAEAA